MNISINYNVFSLKFLLRLHDKTILMQNNQFLNERGFKNLFISLKLFKEMKVQKTYEVSQKTRL